MCSVWNSSVLQWPNLTYTAVVTFLWGLVCSARAGVEGSWGCWFWWTSLAEWLLAVWLLAQSEHWDPLCVDRRCSSSTRIMSPADPESTGQGRRERKSDSLRHCACVSVSDCWLLEYKWDVLVHLNQGHMLGPTVKCSERNEALYCICHSASHPGLPYEPPPVTFTDWLQSCHQSFFF